MVLFYLLCDVAVCQTYSMFLIFYFLVLFKGPWQWVIKYYINISKENRRWFLIQNLKERERGKDDLSHLDRNLNFSSHILKTHTQFSLLTSQAGPESLPHIHVLNVNYTFIRKTMDGRRNFNISAHMPQTSYHWTSRLIDPNRIAGHISNEEKRMMFIWILCRWFNVVWISRTLLSQEWSMENIVSVWLVCKVDCILYSLPCFSLVLMSLMFHSFSITIKIWLLKLSNTHINTSYCFKDGSSFCRNTILSKTHRNGDFSSFVVSFCYNSN